MNSVYLLPPLVAVSLLCLLPAVAPALARLHAARLTLGTLLLLPLLLVLCFKLQISPASATLLSIALLGAGCIVAPLVDRARSIGAMLAASLGGIAALFATMYFFSAAQPLALFTTGLTTALLIGFAGSALLPMSTLRHTSTGATRFTSPAQYQLLAGWALLALSIALLAQQFIALSYVPLLVSALSAAALTLLTNAQETTLQKTGEALVAGTLITLAAPLSPEIALLAGALAALCVHRGEAATQALKLDDPLHMAGALLAPLVLGTLLPGALDITHLAPALTQLGHALAAAALVSLILWPVVMIFTGLALPPRLAREFVRRP